MPQPALDDVDRRALVNRVGGVAMSEVVQADLEQPCTLGGAVEVAVARRCARVLVSRRGTALFRNGG